MSNSMRSILCMVCMCSSVPLFGMERLKAWVGIQSVAATKNLTVEDRLNQIADEFVQKMREAELRQPENAAFYASVLSAALAGSGMALLGVAIAKKTDSNLKKVGIITGGAVSGMLVGRCSVYVLGDWHPTYRFGSQRADEKFVLDFTEAKAECLKKMADERILSAQIDESKLTPEAKVLLAEVRKRAAVKKAQK